MRSQGSLGPPKWKSGRMMERWYELPQLGFSSSLIYSTHGDEEGDNLEKLNDVKKKKQKKKEKRKSYCKSFRPLPYHSTVKSQGPTSLLQQ